ncbi:MAG TPA: hypothetical protein VGQ45_04295 [Gaiellales bacterium]|jgi:hypothetical protein|nr:hypothetical protein [Gaiellales bacterium]
MDRDERARNERLLRETNWEIAEEGLNPDSGEAVDAEELVFVCACGRPSCTAELLLTVGEYRAVHELPHRFVVAPGHASDKLERVAEKHSSYWVVEKLAAYQT